MSFDSTVILNDNRAFLEKIGYLSVVAGMGGPYPRAAYASVINQFQLRETAASVAVGDYAQNGVEYGKVSAVERDDDPVAYTKITVQFVQTIKPAGIEPADWNPVRTVVYYISEEENDANTAPMQAVAWQKLGSLGVVFFFPVTPDPVTAPAITLESATPTIQQGGPATSLDFNIGGVSIQKTVNGTPSGSPVVANGSGVASISNGATAGQLVRFVVSKEGYNTVTFGPYTVAAP